MTTDRRAMSSFETDANIRELHEACREGHVDILKHLLKQKVRASTLDPRGNPPIVVAATHGNAECVQVLCQNNIRVDQPTHKTGDTALSLVLGKFTAANKMPKASMEEQHARNEKARRAWNARLEEVVLTLLELGADPVTPRHLGATPLHIASYHGFNAAVRLLLSQKYYKINEYGKRVDVSVHVVDKLVRTPLHRASSNGHGDVANTLLRFGADPLARDKFGRSSLQVGLELQHGAVVSSILNVWCRESLHGVPVSKEEMLLRVRLMQQEIHRPCRVATTPKRRTARLQNSSLESSENKQSSLVVAAGNVELVDLLLQGPECLRDVMAEQVEDYRAMFDRKKQLRGARKYMRDLMRQRRDRQAGNYHGDDLLSKHKPIKEKAEPQWLYLDSTQDGKVLGPVPSSKMRDWWQQGKLNLGMLVWNIPTSEDSALIDGPPDAGAMCNMPARGQGPSALGPTWDPFMLPHRKREPIGVGKFAL